MDITLRALDILKSVEVIYCEDTRQTSKLCSRYDIATPLQTYHEHNAEIMRPRILKRLKEGSQLALVSDAGTPLISDPGYKLVRACMDENIKVQTTPGACSPIAALVSSGLPTDQFYFLGFIPTKSAERKNILQEMMSCPATQIFFDTANRLLDTLEDVQEILGDREICVARELTKTFEEIKRGSAKNLRQYFQAEGILKGEIVLLIKGSKEEKALSPVIDEVLKALINQVPVKQATSWLSELSGLSKNLLYKRALEIKELSDER